MSNFDPVLLNIQVKGILVVWSVVLIFLCSRKIHSKEAGRYGIMYHAMLIANVGYAFMAMATDVGSYRIGIILTYFGGAFSICSMSVIAFSICKVKENIRPLINFITVVTSITAFLAVSIMRGNYFFKEDTLKFDEVTGAIKGDVVLGAGGYIYLLVIVIYMIVMIGEAVHAIKNPNKVPVKYALSILGMSFICGFIFCIQQAIFHYLDLVPYCYCIAGTGHLVVAMKTQLFDVTRVLEQTNEQYNDKGIMVLDKQRRYLGCNDYQLKAAPNLGSLKLGEPIPDDFRFSDMYTAAYNELDALPATATIERQLSFGPKKFKIIIRNLLDENMKKVGYVVENIDDTKIQSYIEKINQINEELTIANEKAMVASQAKTVFLASMTHELRTPINAVLGLNSVVLRDTKEENIRELAEGVQNAGNAVLSMVNDVLDISKLETGKMNVVPDKYDLASMITDCYNMVSYKAVDKGLSFTIENDEKLPSKLYGDEVRIRQIVVNLLTNALKYTERGSILLRVWGEAVTAADTEAEKSINLCISVKDTGKGISEEGLELLFADFTRVDEHSNKHIEGTGLGLSIVRQLVELMSGEIHVDSKLGEGSEFVVTIPQPVVDDTEIGSISRKLRKRNTEVGNEINQMSDIGGQVLIVDDVRSNRRVFSMLLNKTKLEIDEADSADSAIAMTKEKKYDIIFMDHMMPDKNGIEAYREIVSDSDNINCRTPMIMLTANVSPEFADMYREEGFAGYLAKPIIVKELNKILTSVLQ